ncbi:MAG TPA: hypothetical protein GXZ28_07775 [Clostridiales bacterium]|nr:hypothetical protein [Clostridiales bacterium]
MKKFKRILSALITGAMLLSCMAFPAAADVKEEKAYLAYADESWKYQYWGEPVETGVVATDATVTGPGQYKVGLDFTGTADGKAYGLAFAAPIIKNGNVTFKDHIITVDSIEINGQAVEFTKGYTSSDDGVELRSNIFNSWVSELPDDARTADGNLEDASAVVIDPALCAEVETIYVTFTLSEGTPTEEGEEGSAEAVEGTGEPVPVYLAYADESWTYQYWGEPVETGVVATDATVTGPGQYKVGLDFTGTADGKAYGLAFAAPIIKNGSLSFPGYIMTLDAIEVNGAPIEFTKGYTSSDDAVEMRTNIYNSWVSELPPDARTADGSLEGASPVVIDPALFAEVETVFVTFTLSEPVAGEATEPAAEEPEEEYVMPSEFTAYMLFSSLNGNWECYDPLENGANTVTVLGDGTYEVVMRADDIGATGPADAAQVFIIDIIDMGTAMEHLGTVYASHLEGGVPQENDIEVSAEVYVDGNKVSFKSGKILYGDFEDKGRFRMEFYNEWGFNNAMIKNDPPTIPENICPEEEIKVIFKLKGTGLNTEAAAAEEAAAEAAKAEEEANTTTPAAEETSAPVKDEGGLSTGVIIGIVVAAVVVIAVVVVVLVMGKKKKQQ